MKLSKKQVHFVYTKNGMKKGFAKCRAQVLCNQPANKVKRTLKVNHVTCKKCLHIIHSGFQQTLPLTIQMRLAV
jgi:hypothetical protein